MRTAGVAFLGTLIVALIAWFGLTLSDETASDAGAMPVEVAGRPELAAHAHDPLAVAVIERADPLPSRDSAHLELPSDVKPSAATTAVEAVGVVPRVTRGDNTHREYVAAELFEDFYAGASDDEIIIAEARIGSRVLGLIEETVQSRLASGLVDEQEIIDLTKVTAEELLEQDRERRGEQDGLYHNVTAERLPNGLLLRKHLTVPWDAHTSVYDLQDELYWLRRERRRRR